ncbi:hypothetical protein [Nonomuraea fuscirosea]|uniref:hypothetical protein n=1 Tax=Nonomuraea fuscirosea TaxID=1291556 RepID=UPI0033C7D18A
MDLDDLARVHDDDLNSEPAGQVSGPGAQALMSQPPAQGARAHGNACHNVIDFERKPSHSEAHLTVASITLMTRRLTRKRPPAWTRRPASVPQAA